MNSLLFLKRGGVLILTLLSLLVMTACEEVDTPVMDSQGDQANVIESEVIVIGAVGPLSGDAAVYGVPLQRIAEIAKDRINENGGINGKKIKFVWEDGMCSKEAANKSANKLINVDGVEIIFGGFCSDETLGISSLAETSGVVTFSPASSSPKLTNAGDYIFRNWPSDSSQGKILAKYALDQGYKKIGVIHEQTDYALGVKDTFEAAIVGGEGEVVVESFASETSDFRTPLLKMKGEGVDAIFIDSQTGAKADGIIKQLKEMDFKVPLLGNDVVMGSTETIVAYADFIDGMVGAEGSYDNQHPEWIELEARYKEKYKEDVPYAAYMAAAYDGVYILTEAISAVGNDADAVKGYLYGIKGRKGVAGMLSIDANGDPETGHILRVIKNGKVENL